MKTKIAVVVFAALSATSVFAQHRGIEITAKTGYAVQPANELISGTTHIIWLKQTTVEPPPGMPARSGMWVYLHSDDPTVTHFAVTIHYKLTATDTLHTESRLIDNNPKCVDGCAGYWVADPLQCIFWIGIPPQFSFSITALHSSDIDRVPETLILLSN